MYTHTLYACLHVFVCLSISVHIHLPLQLVYDKGPPVHQIHQVCNLLLYIICKYLWVYLTNHLYIPLYQYHPKSSVSFLHLPLQHPISLSASGCGRKRRPREPCSPWRSPSRRPGFFRNASCGSGRFNRIHLLTDCGSEELWSWICPVSIGKSKSFICPFSGLRRTSNKSHRGACWVFVSTCSEAIGMCTQQSHICQD